MATSANQQGVVGADSGAIWMWTEACVILRGYSPFKMTFCLVDLLRRHLFLSFYNASPLLSTFFLISPAYLVSRCATRGYVAVIGYPPPEPLLQQVTEAINQGEPVPLPDAVVSVMTEKRLQEISKRSYTEIHRTFTVRRKTDKEKRKQQKKSRRRNRGK